MRMMWTTEPTIHPNKKAKIINFQPRNSPQTAIANGFGHAWATILDSNVTTLIAGVALLVFGTGPIRGFAVVHVLGILTSLFSSVFVSRGLANLWYGRRKKLTSLSIGQIWRPDNTATNDKK